jgi:hypothetical protein
MMADKTAPPEDKPAADGGGLPPAARSFDAMVRMLEDGTLNADLSDSLREIAATLSNFVIDYGGEPKAKLSLELSFALKDGVFEIVANTKLKLPDKPRGRTVAWCTGEHYFTPNNPKQGQLFGLRDA